MSFADVGIVLSTTARGQVKTLCPICSPERKKKNDRCLSVNVEDGAWNCHHCGWSGALGQSREKRVYKKPDFRPLPLADAQTQWLNDRGITNKVLKRNKISTAKIWMPQRDSEVGAIAFPYFRGEECINIKYRDGSKNFRMAKDAELCLYGINDVSDKTIIVEGEIDKLSFEVAGFKNCVSVPNGAPPADARNYDAKLEYLAADQKTLESCKEWIIAVDSDAAGTRLREELTRRLGVVKVKHLTWPDGVKDANEALQKIGVEGIQELMLNTKAPPIRGVYDTVEVAARIFNLQENGAPRGLPTGFRNLDAFYTVQPGEVTIVTGIPNSGKSNWVDCLVVNLGAQHEFQTAFFSPENQPLEDHMLRIIEKLARKPSGDLTQQELAVYITRARDLFHWVLPDDDEWTLENVLDTAGQLVFRHGIRGLVIDPWNELESGKERGQTETEFIGEALKKIRQFARRTGLHIWIVAHPAKLYRNQDGNYPVPSMYDIAGSSHWRNKADNGICVWRDFSDKTAPVDVHVQKVRFRQTGTVGLASFDYKHGTATYEPTLIRH